MTDELDREAPALPVGPGTDDIGADERAAAERAAAERAAADASLLALVDRLAALLDRSDLTELELEAGGTSLLLRKAAAPGPPPVMPAAVRTAALPRPAPVTRGRSADGVAEGGPPAPAANERAAVLAPLTGIYYASPSPDSPPFVAIGREVAVGQVIGLIEAMKLFNEIKSDRAGRVVRVVPENGMLVRARSVLIEVEPL